MNWGAASNIYSRSSAAQRAWAKTSQPRWNSRHLWWNIYFPTFPLWSSERYCPSWLLSSRCEGPQMLKVFNLVNDINSFLYEEQWWLILNTIFWEKKRFTTVDRKNSHPLPILPDCLDGKQARYRTLKLERWSWLWPNVTVYHPSVHSSDGVVF